MKEFESRLTESTNYLRARVNAHPTIAVVLGSGLGDFASSLTEPTVFLSKDIPHYPRSTVDGHAGKLLFGKLRAEARTSPDIIVFQGRIHFYESNDTDVAVYPIQIANRLGVKRVIVTNSAGGVNRTFAPGDLMFIRDYLNLSFENPLRGMSQRSVGTLRPAFSEELLAKAKAIAVQRGIPFKEGVYCWTQGPAYESAAEIRMMGAAGADAVGMSTVPEVIAAAALGMEVVGISCITNLATGLGSQKLSHAEVKEVANKVRHNFVSLLTHIVLGL